jgi:uncharacterized membrane protein YdbT with pleckstrin-like domain
MVLGAIVLSMIIPSSEGGILGFIRDLMSWARWILLVAGVVWIAYNIVVWRTAEFVVTNLRVLRTEGLIQRRSSETMLSAVSDVKLEVGLIGKTLGYGNIKIFTQSGDAGADAFNSITGAAAFRNAMMGVKMKDQIDSRPIAPAPAPVAPAPVPAAPVVSAAEDQASRLVKLAELRDQGVISPAEFEAKKTEILSRM